MRIPIDSKKWPETRTALEFRMVGRITRFVSAGSYVSKNLRAFAADISELERSLAILDAKEAKKNSIRT